MKGYHSSNRQCQTQEATPWAGSVPEALTILPHKCSSMKSTTDLNSCQPTTQTITHWAKWGNTVVIAVLPVAEYGPASVAIVVANMLNSFANVRIGLMVGIGGGVPRARHDIRLSDLS